MVHKISFEFSTLLMEMEELLYSLDIVNNALFMQGVGCQDNSSFLVLAGGEDALGKTK